MPETGSFFDVDPENWKEYVDSSSGSGASTFRSGGKNSDGKPKKLLEEVAPAIDYRPYWQVQLELVNAWANYQKAKRLLINASYEETRHRVSSVVKDYWGDNQKLKRSVEERSALVDAAIRRADLVSERFGVGRISRDWLYRNLKEARDYSSYRGKIKRRLDRNKPAKSLREI